MNMREDFEKWLSNCLGPFVDMSRDDDGVYEWQDVRLAWLAWKAARPKWTECSNPPEEECSVLLLDADNIVWTGIYFPTHGFEIDTKGCPGALTRWMPLPNTPEGDE